jgi:hypothetical protein
MADEYKDDDMVARMERLLREKETPKETAVGTIMKNGGGAAAGGAVGYTAGTVAAVALAPITGGLSILVAPLFGIAGAVAGHRMSKDME